MLSKDDFIKLSSELHYTVYKQQYIHCFQQIKFVSIQLERAIHPVSHITSPDANLKLTYKANFYTDL